MRAGQHMTEEQRARVSLGGMGRIVSPETRAKIAAGNTGKTRSLEARAKDSAWHKGRPAWNKGIPMSAEQKVKNAECHKGQVPWNQGIPRTKEEKGKLSLAQVGHTMPAKTREGIAASQIGHLMSRTTLLALLKANRGESNPNWKGGITPENDRIRHSPEYIAWRTAVFERDNYTCQECRVPGGCLEAHHIHEFAQYPDERFVVENGKTLCLKCHDKTKSRKAHVIEVIP